MTTAKYPAVDGWLWGGGIAMAFNVGTWVKRHD